VTRTAVITSGKRAHPDANVPQWDLDGDENLLTRVAVEERLLANDLKALVATSALGMGYDKPDRGFVVHDQAPGSVIYYY
jgi:ATP-dependent DNA helicase RecQ